MTLKNRRRYNLGRILELKHKGAISVIRERKDDNYYMNTGHHEAGVAVPALATVCY
jgi:hypothetical protein